MNTVLAIMLTLNFYPSTPMVITINIKHILQYYEEEENIIHKTIGLYATLTPEDFERTLTEVQKEYPDFEFKFIQLIKDKRRCMKTDEDLSILIPSDILMIAPGKFQFSFQSHLKNIFGTLDFEVILEEGNLVSKNKQFIVTSIGN